MDIRSLAQIGYPIYPSLTLIEGKQKVEEERVIGQGRDVREEQNIGLVQDDGTEQDRLENQCLLLELAVLETHEIKMKRLL